MQTKDIYSIIPFYKPKKIKLNKTKNSSPENNFVKMKFKNPLELRNFAIKGLERISSHEMGK